jgi:hypothetical protein
MCHLLLTNFAFPIQSPLLATADGLVTLSLSEITPFGYFFPYELIQCLSLLRHLEVLEVAFNNPPLIGYIEREPLQTSITTSVTLPRLRWLGF